MAFVWLISQTAFQKTSTNLHTYPQCMSISQMQLRGITKWQTQGRERITSPFLCLQAESE